jgi:predicted nucleic acid-binding protein
MMRNWLLIGMKNMVSRILVDTNILLDYLLTREPFYEDAKKVVLTCTEGETEGCIAAHSISNMFYILRKDYDVKDRREILTNLCTIFDVEGIDKVKLLSGLQNENFSDFEDCLQMECAKAYNAEYIVTRNVDDYRSSEVKAILPKDYLKL